MNRQQYRTESYGWLSTAYHEAGHAVAILLLGRVLLLVEVRSPSEGAAWVEREDDQFADLVDQANKLQRVSPDLLRIWRDEFMIADAGTVAVEEFNLVSQDDIARGSLGDVLAKIELIPDAEDYAFVKAYFHRHVGAWQHLINASCRALFRQQHVSALTRTLAEALLRSRRLEGDEVLDTLLFNRAALTGQEDLFWSPVGDDPFAHRRVMIMPSQMRLSGI